jgi:hypothetical protein
MYKDKSGHDWRISIVTPAGREEYLSIFKKYIYKEMEKGLVDEWQLWQNTIKPSDIDYLASMAAENPKVVVHKLEEEIIPAWRNTNALLSYKFMKHTHDANTIYIRLDDDIVWYEPGALERIIFARIACPNAFAIYPNVINSTVLTSWHQEIGALGLEAGAVHKQSEKPEDPNWIYLDEFCYTDSKLIDLIHDTFQKRYEQKTLPAYYLPNRSFDNYQRFSICVLAWWGRDKIEIGELEEAQLSWEMPAKLERPIFFVGDALFVHYSYHTQIEHLESEGHKHLEFYKQLSEKL